MRVCWCVPLGIYRVVMLILQHLALPFLLAYLTLAFAVLQGSLRWSCGLPGLKFVICCMIL